MSTATHVLEGPDLEQLLARVPDELGPQATIVAANKVRSGGIGGFFAKERFEVVVEVPEGTDPGAAADQRPPAGPRLDLAAEPPLAAERPQAAGLPPVAAPAPAGRLERFAGVLERMVRDAGADDGPAREDEDAPFVPLVAPRVSQPAVEAALEPPLADHRPPVHLTSPTPVHAVLDRAWLEDVGLPATLQPQARPVREDLLIELLHLMEQLPAAEPLPRGGSVIAVLGERKQALDVARTLAGEIGVDPAAVLVATNGRRDRTPPERRIDGPESAAGRRRSWRRRRTPTVVAIDAPPGCGDAAWAASVVDALEPTAAWGVVEAYRKPEDLRVWAEAVGGIDALAVTGLEDTCSPASVLRVGLPVGLLDGEAATPIRWTALLARRLEVAA
jgi:hypothetical protein